MRTFRALFFIFPALLLIVAFAFDRHASATTAPPVDLSPMPVITLPTSAGKLPSPSEDDPIHMPYLIGHTLEYATGIWDSEDEDEMPQFRVERLSNAPDLVVVSQQPTPGTLIVPAHTLIVITLGQGPIQRPNAQPTPSPDPNVFAAAAGQATLLRPPYVQNLTTTSVTIVWTTVEDGANEVNYGIGNYNSVASATSTYFTTPAAVPYDHYYVHQTTLNNLTADTAYQYKIFTNGADLTPGGPVTFRTAKPPSAGTFRFVVLGDSGDGSQNQKDVATRLLQVQPDLVLHDGDFIYSEASYDLFEKRYFQIYKDLIKSVWIAPVLGNRDVTYNNGKSFTDVFVNPPNATNVNERELYYSFDYGNAHFTVLNNYFAMTTVGSTQYNWMVNDLASTDQFWKFVVLHEPPYVTNSSQDPRGNAAIVSRLVPLFEQYNVDMVFSGHWHYYERMYPLRRGQVSTVDAGAVVYIVTGGGGAGLGDIGTGTLNPLTAAKVRKFHLTMMDVQGCSLQLSAVEKVSGTTDTFDSSDVFDTYNLNRCGGTTVTNTPTKTAMPTATATQIATLTPTFTPTSTVTSTATQPPSEAQIDTFVGGAQQESYFVSHNNSHRKSYAGVNSGPVKIASTNGVPIIASERVIYKSNNINTSYSEMIGLSEGQLDNVYWLPWYNNVDLDTQLRLANVSDSPALVTVTVGGTNREIFSLATGESVRKSYAGVNSGPVRIASTQNIVAAERVVYKINGINTSFSEMMALPANQVNTTYWLPWYNNVDLDTQLRIANMTDQPATVTVTIGGVPKPPIRLAAGESTRLSYAGVSDGPVQIVSDAPIVAAERVIYKVNGVNTSFTEMMALPDSQLDNIYWLPWYNNVDLDTQLRFANTTDSTATVHVYIGGVEMSSSPFSLTAGASTRQSFVNINNGPVQIVSDVPIVAAERVIYKVNGVNTSFTEMIGLPNRLLDTTFWLPWYNNVDLDTQLRFGVP